MKTRLLILLTILSVVSYVVIVETDNYFNGSLTDNVSTPTSSDILSMSNSHSFMGDGNMTFYAEWCSQTEGVWVDSTCHFKNQEMFEKAGLALDEFYKSKITGITAKNVCTILEISCPDEPVFDANFNPDRNISGFIYFKGDVVYTFNVRDNEIKYKIEEEDSQWMTFGDPTNHERFSRTAEDTIDSSHIPIGQRNEN